MDTTPDAGYYGNLAKVAINFYIQTGNPAELDATFVYARDAAHRANRTFTTERNAQGFRSQAHLDAFYAHYDHTKHCPDCHQLNSFVELFDGWQPTQGQCPIAGELDRRYFELDRHVAPTLADVPFALTAEPVTVTAHQPSLLSSERGL